MHEDFEMPGRKSDFEYLNELVERKTANKPLKYNMVCVTSKFLGSINLIWIVSKYYRVEYSSVFKILDLTLIPSLSGSWIIIY